MRFLLCALALTACNQGEAPTAVAPKGPSPAIAQKARLVPKDGAGAMPELAPASQPGYLPAGHPPMGGDLPAGHPPMGDSPHGPHGAAMGSLPAGHPPMGEVPAAYAGEAGGAIKGTIDVSPALREKVAAGSVLFLIVRGDAGEGQRGPMLAAKKVPITGAAMFPYAYEISSADVMLKGSALAGAVRVEARADGDGDAMSKLPGDLTGGPVATEVGKDGVNFVLETAL